MGYSYNTVSGEKENLIIVERSKFICNIKGVEDEADAKAYIEMLRKRHSLANHSCYAYIADDKGLVQKFSDAGEPQGTAGMPMLEVLKQRKIYKTVAVVTRYFGGIKLGTGGLTRAYGGSVADCLNMCDIKCMCEANELSVDVEYDGYSRLLKLITNENIHVLSTDFVNSVKVSFAVKNEYVSTFKEKIRDNFNGKLEIQEIGSGYYSF